MQAPLPYMRVLPVDAWDIDRSHLKTLAICHYVWGGLEILFSSFGILYIVFGLVFLNDPGSFGPTTATRGGGPAAATAPAPPPQQAPEFVGWMFVAMGSCVVLLGWTTGILTILSGRGIARRRARTFSIVMSGINCISFPIGTTLGVFTLIVLLRASVIALYKREREQEQAATHGTPVGT